MEHYDVVVAGGGMAGSSLACLLASKAPTLRILLVEGFTLNPSEPLQYRPSFDARSTALSHSSYQFYNAIKYTDGSTLWQKLQEHLAGITDIHVSDKGRAGQIVLNAKDEKMQALGYVVENQWLGAVLQSSLGQYPQITLACPAKVQQIKMNDQGQGLVTFVQEGAEQTVCAKLTVIADGVESENCKKLGIGFDIKPYQQSALITNITLGKPHNGVAYERFTEQGPLALLPLPDDPQKNPRSALVWTGSPDTTQKRYQLPEDDFLQQLQECFGYRVGRFKGVSERVQYPLRRVQAKEQIRQGIVVVGNAAHTLHPVAGQGFNLTLRDLAVLVEVIVSSLKNKQPIGSLAALQHYEATRQADQVLTIDFSERVTHLFSYVSPLVGAGRDMGLLGMNLIKPLRSAFVRQATGLAVKKPDVFL